MCAVEQMFGLAGCYSLVFDPGRQIVAVSHEILDARPEHRSSAEQLLQSCPVLFGLINQEPHNLGAIRNEQRPAPARNMKKLDNRKEVPFLHEVIDWTLP